MEEEQAACSAHRQRAQQYHSTRPPPQQQQLGRKAGLSKEDSTASLLDGAGHTIIHHPSHLRIAPPQARRLFTQRQRLAPETRRAQVCPTTDLAKIVVGWRCLVTHEPVRLDGVGRLNLNSETALLLTSASYPSVDVIIIRTRPRRYIF